LLRPDVQALRFNVNLPLQPIRQRAALAPGQGVKALTLCWRQAESAKFRFSHHVHLLKTKKAYTGQA